MSMRACVLCFIEDVVFFHKNKQKEFLKCNNCKLVFVSEQYLPSKEAEIHEYSLHNNNPGDKGYRKWLSKVTKPLAEKVAPPATGLDFGCGPGPTLGIMMSEEDGGYTVRNYDPFFFNDKTLIGRNAAETDNIDESEAKGKVVSVEGSGDAADGVQSSCSKRRKTDGVNEASPPSPTPSVGGPPPKYDFIAATEVFEHFHQPRKELELLDTLLKPGSVLAIMTGMVDNEDKFASWWYHRDPTHVCFFREETMKWIGDTMGWDVEFVAKTVTFFTKRDAINSA